MPDTEQPANAPPLIFSFFKGKDDVTAPRSGKPFDWQQAATIVREHVGEAMNAKNVAFLLGSGCSSYVRETEQLGIPTMQPLAEKFIGTIGADGDNCFSTAKERAVLRDKLGIDITKEKYGRNLETLMQVLFSVEFLVAQSAHAEITATSPTVSSVIAKLTEFILKSCTEGRFASGDETVFNLYQSFYRKLIYRDRALPHPWVFTSNYDLFNETAMDRVGIPYFNGFSGTIERRFNPATFRYSLAEQLDISSRKWTAVDSVVYLCKLHGSVNWIEENKGLFPIRELQIVASQPRRVMIFPTPAKQNASFGSPYSDLFREFQSRIVRDQSVLFVVGYSFSDEHINNIIFQALTVATFRVVIFAAPDHGGAIEQLRNLGDPRIWIIGGDGPANGEYAHFFHTFIDHFMPESPGDKVDKDIYRAVDAAAAEAALTAFEEGSWGRKYPAIGQSWRRAWAEVTPFYAFPGDVQRILYTTNAIEALNSKLRRAVRARGHFPSDEAATKLLFLVLNRSEKEWIMPPREWCMTTRRGRRPSTSGASEAACRGRKKPSPNNTLEM